MSRRYAIFGKNHSERDIIENTYNTETWSIVISTLKRKNRVSKEKVIVTPESIKLAQKIKKELGIDVFPAIIRTRAGFSQKSNGAWSFYMLMPNLLDIGSCETVNYLLKKNVKFELLNNELIGESF